MGTKVLKTIYIVDIYQCMLISSKALKYSWISLYAWHLKEEEEEEEKLLVEMWMTVYDCFQSLTGLKETAKLDVVCFLIPWLGFL